MPIGGSSLSVRAATRAKAAPFSAQRRKVRCGASDAIEDPSLNEVAFHCMKGSAHYRLPSGSLDHYTATTIGANHDATPSHANQGQHKHSEVDRSKRICRRVDMRTSRSQQTPSPSTPTLVEKLRPKAAQRLRVTERSVDALVRSPLQGTSFYYHAIRTRGGHYQGTRTSNQQRSVGSPARSATELRISSCLSACADLLVSSDERPRQVRWSHVHATARH